MIKWISIATLVVLVSCSRTIERIPEPKNLIPKKKMITVIKEMMKLEGHIQARYGQVAQYYKVMINSGDSLLASYQLDRKTYEASMDYYGSRQEEMQEIYDEALDQLNGELAKLQEKIE